MNQLELDLCESHPCDPPAFRATEEQLLRMGWTRSLEEYAARFARPKRKRKGRKP